MTLIDPAPSQPASTLEKTSVAKLLIADDNEEFRNSLVRLLHHHGFECDGASTSAETLALLQSGGVDALVSDVQMPGNVGLELIHAVSRLAPGLPVVLLTGQPSVETAIRAVNLPVAGYFTKPPQIGELVALLQSSIADYRCLRCVDESRCRLREWDEKLKCFSRSLRSPRPSITKPTAGDYLRNTLQHVQFELAALEQSLSIWNRSSSREADLRKLDLIGAIDHTVKVLGQTKQDFKSVKLADLRRYLEELLAHE